MGGCDGCERPGAKWAVIQAKGNLWRPPRLAVAEDYARFHLRGLVAELAERGLKVDYRSVWPFVYAERSSASTKRGGWRAQSSRGGWVTSPVDQIGQAS